MAKPDIACLLHAFTWLASVAKRRSAIADAPRDLLGEVDDAREAYCIDPGRNVRPRVIVAVHSGRDLNGGNACAAAEGLMRE